MAFRGTLELQRSIQEKRLNSSYYDFAQQRQAAFVSRFGEQTAQRESTLKQELSKKEKVFLAKEKLKRGIEGQSVPTGLVLKTQKAREARFGVEQQGLVSSFNVETASLFEEGKANYEKELEIGRKTRDDFYEVINVGYRSEAGALEKYQQGLAKKEYESALAAEIARQQAEFESTWKSTGGTYVGEYGQGFSSAKSPIEMGLRDPFVSQPTNYLSKLYKPTGFEEFVTITKKIISEPVKISNFDETNFGLIESRRTELVKEAKINYTTNFFEMLGKAQQQMILIPQEIIPQTYDLNKDYLLKSRRNISGILELSASKAFISGVDTLKNYDKNAFILDKYFVSGGIAAFEFIGSMGGEVGRNVGLMYYGRKDRDTQQQYLTVYGQNIPTQKLSVQQVYSNIKGFETTGRLIAQAAPYFISSEISLLKAIIDISQAKEPKEVIEPLLMVGGITLGTKVGLKLFEYAPLRISALFGGNIVKGGEILKFSSKAAQYPEYFAKASKYVAPVVLGGYGAYSLAGSASYLYSNDSVVAREAERRLFVSFGAGYFGGAGGDYLGTEFTKGINPKISYQTIVQGGSGLGKLSKQEKALVDVVFKRAYGKELPVDIQLVMPVKQYTSKYLKVFEEFTPKQQKALIKITDKTIREFAKELYLGGSSGIPSQISGKFWKKSGDIDVFFGSKRFAEALEKNINTVGIKGVKAKGTYDLEGAHLNLLRNGKLAKEQFVNVHFDLSMTKGQLTKFGEMFQTTKGAFIRTPEGYKLFNIREQLRGKIEGYYFGGRAKDLPDLIGIVKGTEKASKLYKEYKTKNVLLDERAMFAPINEKATKSFLPKISSKKQVQEAYSPYTQYKIPLTSKYFVPSYASYETYSTPKSEYYKMSYAKYPTANYILNYKPSYPIQYKQEYASTYQAPYQPTYPTEYLPEYLTPYTPKYNPPYQPKYAPPYTTTTYPKYKPTTYKPPYVPTYKSPTKTYLKRKDDFSKYIKKQEKYYAPKGKTKLYKAGNISNVILPIKTDWLKAIKYYEKKPRVKSIKLLPSKRKGFKQISDLLGVRF